MGSMIELFRGPSTHPLHRTYVSGDTLMFDDLADVPARFPDVDLAVVHLGGTRVLGVLVTMDAEQGVAFLRLVRPRVAVPVHFDDYTVFKSPLKAFRTAVEEADLDVDVRYLDRGDRYQFALRNPNR